MDGSVAISIAMGPKEDRERGGEGYSVGEEEAEQTGQGRSQIFIGVAVLDDRKLLLTFRTKAVVGM